MYKHQTQNWKYLYVTFETALSKSDFQNVSFDIVNHMNALYISKDNYLVKTLCNIYNEVTNSNLEPIAIGGATFARAFDNCISFGANLPGNKDMCHQTDEFISIDNLLLACKIYAMAILKLGNNWCYRKIFDFSYNIKNSPP